MLPLPYATKENYKVILYRLADCDPEKVSVSASALFDSRFSLFYDFSKSLLYPYHYSSVALFTKLWIASPSVWQKQDATIILIFIFYLILFIAQVLWVLTYEN